MSNPLSYELRERFLAIDEVWGKGGEPTSFIFAQPKGTGGVKLIHPGLSRERSEEGRRERRIGLSELEELNDAELIDMKWTGDARGQFRVTANGRQYADRLRRVTEHARPLAGEGGGPLVDELNWGEQILPVLHTLYTVYAAQPDYMGVSQELLNAQLGRAPSDQRTDAVLAELERAGYIEASVQIDETLGPAFSRPTEKALKLVAGWPGDMNADATVRLMAEIDQRIETADTADERNRWVKLRDGVAGIGRDLFVDVMSSVLKGEL